MTPATEDEQNLSAKPCCFLSAIAERKIGSSGFVSSCIGMHDDVRPVLSGLTRHCKIFAEWATVLFLILSLSGCGLTSLTDGGIPNGKSVIKGRVIVSDNPQQPLANYTVTVITTPTGKPTATYRVVTDAQGLFTVNDIVTGKHLKNGPLSVTNVAVSVDPGKTPYQAQKVNLLLTENKPANVVMALPPVGFDLAQVGGVSVTSPLNASSSVTTGTTFQFTARLLDRNNNPLVSAATGQYFVPSLVLSDLAITGIGTNGLFQATGTSEGVSTIAGTVSLPGHAPPITSQLLDVPVVPAVPNNTGGGTQTLPGVPSPPLPPSPPSNGGG